MGEERRGEERRGGERRGEETRGDESSGEEERRGEERRGEERRGERRGEERRGEEERVRLNPNILATHCSFAFDCSGPGCSGAPHHGPVEASDLGPGDHQREEARVSRASPVSPPRRVGALFGLLSPYLRFVWAYFTHLLGLLKLFASFFGLTKAQLFN